MIDLALTVVWLSVLAAGIALGVALRRIGVATTYVRDLLHVGAGAWVLGWTWWSRPFAPISIVLLALALAVALPRWRCAAPIVRAISDDDESWLGIVAYTASAALWTSVGLLGDPLPASIALLALALGDGIGGFVGRSFGRVVYRSPFAKAKTVEGSAAVFAGALAAIPIAGALFGSNIVLLDAVAIAAAAAIAEAVAPRSTDNLVVPLAAGCVAAWVR
jgi:dolichol kinase